MSFAPLSVVSAEVETLTLDFLMGLDTGDFRQLVDCMAADGIWHRQGKVLQGHAMILDALAARGSDVRTAHLVSNFRLNSADAVVAEARFLMVAYRYDGPVREDEPSPIDVPFSIALYRCRYAAIDGQWKITEIQSQPRFRR
jgi:hypothetical protein